MNTLLGLGGGFRGSSAQGGGRREVLSGTFDTFVSHARGEVTDTSYHRYGSLLGVPIDRPPEVMPGGGLPRAHGVN